MSGQSYRVLTVAGQDEFNPFRFQREFMAHMNGHTPEEPARALCVWPRRHGKDLTALSQLIVMAHDKVGMYWHGLPTYEQARKSCWTAFLTSNGKRLMDSVFPREVVRRPSEWAPAGEMLVELKNGSLIQFVGSDTIDSLVGAGLLGLNGSEFALWRPSAYDFVRPMLRESRGWAAFLMTPRGHNHAYKTYEKWKVKQDAGMRRFYVSHLDIFTAGRYSKAEAEMILAEEREEGMAEEMIAQEYMTDFTAAMVGSYWGAEIQRLEREGKLAAFEHERDGIFLVFDLGINDSTAIWAFRLTDGGADFVAHYEANSKPMSHFFAVTDAWAEQFGFKYEVVYLPHDARARTLLTGTSIMEAAMVHYKGKASAVQVVPNIGLLEGIQAARQLLRLDVRIHPRCAMYDGVEALRAYHREYDEDNKVFSNKPAHDWSSHTADAFRYGAIMIRLARGHLERKPQRRIVVPKPVVAAPTLNQLWELAASHDAGPRRA
jgi:hypothetical protein